MVQSKLNTPPMTIVIIREASNHDLRHDLGHMEYQRASATLKSVVGVILQVLDLHRLSGSFPTTAVANGATQREGQVGSWFLNTTSGG